VKFGIMNLFPAEGADHDVYHQTLEEIALADELGFDSVWLAEHHFSRYGLLGNPLNFGMAVAARTTKISIGTAVLVLPFYDPIRLAEDIAAIDVLSRGRVQIGVGRGYQPSEFQGFGVPVTESHQRFKEALEIIRLALSEENWSYEGEIFQYENMTTFPRPFTPGGPEILLGTASPESFKTRGALGEPIITSPSFTPLGIIKRNFDFYRAAMVENGHDISRLELPFMQQVWAGHSEEGLTEAATAAYTYYQSLTKYIPGSEDALEAEREYYEKVAQNIKLLTLEQTLTHGGNFGSPQRVIEVIEQLRDELGITHYIAWLRIPHLDRKAALKSMETFATEVIPHFKQGAAERVAVEAAGATA
jgi:alkanesulfonate monooxygenase SsuD/methylene tetrahydromethanopterin reductase-like flavin-dependent oxidoreductase (luciferase family)